MFTAKRVLVLLVVSVLLTALLYMLDTDTPSDTVFRMATNTAIVFAVVAVLYSAVYGIVSMSKKRAN